MAGPTAAAPPAHEPFDGLRDELSDVDDALAELRTRVSALNEPPPASVGILQPDEFLARPSLREYNRPMPEAWLFREEVLVSVGPFADLGEVNAFARALSGLPPKPSAAVWGFDGDEAVIKLSSDEPLQLADADIRDLPHRPRVALATASALTLRLELPPKPRPPGDDGPVLTLHLRG